jgi:transposase
MRALDPETQDTVWEAFEPLIPDHVDTHPYGGHRWRVSDRDCFDVIVTRLATGASWKDSARLAGSRVSDWAVRDRRDTWIDAGVFEAIESEALAALDRVIGLELGEVGVDGSLHKAPCGGEGTGKNPTDRAKLGWKWSIAVDGRGTVVGVAVDGANRNDCVMLEPTLTDVARHGLIADIETIHLDAGYDSAKVRDLLKGLGIDDAVIAHRRRPGEPKPDTRPGLGLRWVVERTNSWLSNFGALRRNNDLHSRHRRAHLGLALVFLAAAKLIDWRNRHHPNNPAV